MDAFDIAEFLAPFVPALSAGHEVTGEDAQLAARLWVRLAGALSATPSRLVAVHRLAEAPDDTGALLAFRVELSRCLAADAALQRDVTELWARRSEPISPEPPPSPPAPVQPARPVETAVRDRDEEYPAPGESGAYPDPTARRGFDEPIPEQPPQAVVRPGAPAGQGAPGGLEGERLLEAWLEDRDLERPWLVTLVVGIGHRNARHHGVIFDHERVFGPDEEFGALDVVVTSADFLVETRPQVLRVPRAGPSRNLARFDLTVPRAPHLPLDGAVNVYLYKSGNFAQALVVQLRAGPDEREITGVEQLARLPLSGAAALRPRQLSLVIRRGGEGYDLTAFGALNAHLMLRITPQELEQIVHDARQALKEVVDLDGGGGECIFQEEVAMPAQVGQAALARLAQAGLLMYRALFYARSDPAALKFADDLRTLAEQKTLKIQVVSDDFFLPWGMLYPASADEHYDRDDVKAERFLGFRHIIEHILVQSPPVPPSLEIPTSPKVSVSCNVDRGIDDDFSISAVTDQLAYWEDLQRSTGTTGTAVQLQVRSTAEEVRLALDDPATEDQIWYFYCHADGGSLSDPGKADASFLQLSNGSRVVRPST